MNLKTKENRARALAALKTMEAFLQGIESNVEGDALTLLQRIEGEGQRMQKANTAFVLALLEDEYTPAILFKPWASIRRIQQWRDAGKLKVVVKHGRCCVKPSEFFTHWRTLPEESRQ
jgi:hypothetical protein